MNKIDLNKTGIELIAEEKARILEVEGFTEDNDKKYKNLELVKASICYLRTPFFRLPIQEGKSAPMEFPFHGSWWKPNPDNRIIELIKAGALIASEIDRLRTETKT